MLVSGLRGQSLAVKEEILWLEDGLTGTLFAVSSTPRNHTSKEKSELPSAVGR